MARDPEHLKGGVPNCRAGRSIHGAKPRPQAHPGAPRPNLEGQRPILTVIRGVEATKRQRSSVTFQMVIAGAQAFDAGLGKLAESILIAMAPWQRITDPMREKGAGVLLGGGRLEPDARARAIFNAMTEEDRRAGKITADMVKAGANALAAGAKYLGDPFGNKICALHRG